MNKSIGLIICLLSAKNVIASEVAVVTSSNFHELAGKLYEAGGQGALKCALTEIQRRETVQALNPEAGIDEEIVTPLELAFEEDSRELCDFFLRNGANPESGSSRGDSFVDRVKSDERYMAIIKRNGLVKVLEPFIIRAIYADSDEILSKILPEIKELVQDKKQAVIEDDFKDELDGNLSEAEGATFELEALDEEIHENLIPVSDADATLEWLKNEKLQEAQVISDLQSALNGKKSQSVIRPSYGIEYIAGALFVGAGGMWLLSKLAIEDGVAN